jgi:hypothetical protein
MATVEQIISDDSWHLSQEAFGTPAAATSSALAGSFSVTGVVDHVSGNGYSGIFIASGLSSGERTFSALVINQAGEVSVFQGTLADDGTDTTVLSATQVAVTNGELGVFPNYMSYSGTDWGYSYFGAEGIATDTTVTTPEIGGIILFRKPGDSADQVTLSQLSIHRVLSGGITFPNQGSTNVDLTGLVDDGDNALLMFTQDSVIHGLVGAPFGDLEHDVGKSVPWTTNFVNDLFILDTNRGDPRYWIVEWDKAHREAKFASVGVDYFTDPVAWRQAQFAAADEAWNYQDEDWVLFVDACEGLSCDTRTEPADLALNPFKSYIHTEIARAITNGVTSVCVPFFAYVRDADVPDGRRFLELADPEVVQDWLQQSGSDVSLDEVNTVMFHAITPYYYQQQDFTKRGLTRLVQVGALRNPAFDWSVIDTLGQPDPDVAIQIISYAYASWVNPANGEDDGLKMRAKISAVRSLLGMPVGGGGATGTAGPFQVAENGVLTWVTPSAMQMQPLLTPLYPTIFRLNRRFGTWYPPGVTAPESTIPPYAFSFPPPTGRGEAQDALVQAS